MGEYQDVSESEWVTVLRLERDDAAVIEQSSWAPGQTEATSNTKIAARWSRVEPGVALQYRNRTDTLEYSQSWSAAEFGAQGEGPGLRPITPSEESIEGWTFRIGAVQMITFERSGESGAATVMRMDGGGSHYVLRRQPD